MSAAGAQYGFNRFGGDLNALKVFYDFETSGQAVSNVSTNFSGSFNGLISGNQSSFWQTPGYGNFTGHLVTVSGTQNLTLSDFSVFFWGNRLNNVKDNVLFSSLESFISGISSGSHIYVNPANKLVYLFNSCSGTQSYASDFNVIGDFAIGISKTSTSVDLYRYDYITRSLFTKHISLDRPGDYFPINHFNIGYAPSGANLINNQFYSGKLDAFVLFSGGVDATNADLLFSKYYDTTTIVTTPLVSGSECTGSFILPTSTTVVTSGIPPTGAYYKQGILIYSQPIVATDKIIMDCAVTGSYEFNQGTLNGPAFNPVNLNKYTYNDIGLYLNGQRLISGKAVITGVFCSTGFFFPRDFDVSSNRRIDGLTNLVATDVLIYDVKSASIYTPQALLSSGTGSFTVDTTQGIGYYLNGQRTQDYALVGSGLFPSGNLNVNDAILIDYFNNSKINNNILVTLNPFLVSGGFIQGTSMVYFNGQRLTLNADYIEINSGEYSSFLLKDIPSTLIFQTNGTDSTWNI